MPQAALLAVFIAVIVVMGCVLDSTSVLLITVPLMPPVAKSFGMDLVWFGIVTVIATEIGLLTPPFGLSVFSSRARSMTSASALTRFLRARCRSS
jgi:TRAP-type C4-dicarboxylate transport system permease large subunit